MSDDTQAAREAFEKHFGAMNMRREGAGYWSEATHYTWIGWLAYCEKSRSIPAAAALLRAEGWTVEEPSAGWQPIATAPRDGTHILIAFGQDGTSSAIYTRNDDDPYPWKFIDTQAQGVPIFNGARDDKYGPSHWKPMPEDPTCNGTGKRKEGE